MGCKIGIPPRRYGILWDNEVVNQESTPFLGIFVPANGKIGQIRCGFVLGLPGLPHERQWGSPRYSRGRVLAAVDPAAEMRGLLITMENTSRFHG